MFRARSRASIAQWGARPPNKREVSRSSLTCDILSTPLSPFSLFADAEVTNFWFVRGLVNLNRLGHFHLKCERLRHLNLNLESFPQQGETRGAAAAGRAPLIADVTLRLTRCPPSRLPPALSPSALSPSLLLLPSPAPNPPNPRLDAGSWKPPQAPPLSLPLCFSLSASMLLSLCLSAWLPRARALSLSSSLLLFLPPTTRRTTRCATNQAGR